MRYIFLFLSFTLFVNISSAQDYIVKKGRLGQKGTISLTASSIPNAFTRIWEKSKYDITRKLPLMKRLSKSYRSQDVPFQWDLFISEKYNPAKPAGLLLLSSHENLFPIPEQWQKVCRDLNLLLLAPNFNNDSTHGQKFNLEIIFFGLDIIKKNYKINEKRIFYVALSNEIEHNAHLHSPSVFPGVIGVRSKVGWDPRLYEQSLGKDLYKDLFKLSTNIYFSLLEPGASITSINANGEMKSDFSIPSTRYKSYIHKSLKFNEIITSNNGFKFLKNELYLQDKLIREIVINGKVFKQMDTKVKADENASFSEVYQNISYKTLYRSIHFLDINTRKEAKEYYAIGTKYLKNRNYKSALDAYYYSANLENENAKREIAKLLKEINSKELKAIKLFVSKNYFEAYKSANQIKKDFSLKYAKKIKDVFDEIKKDQKIILEIKAASFLEKTLNSTLKGPKTKLMAACEKVIKTVPGTKTAEKAQKILESLK